MWEKSPDENEIEFGWHRNRIGHLLNMWVFTSCHYYNTHYMNSIVPICSIVCVVICRQIGRCSFAVATPVKWNKLPQTVRSQNMIVVSAVIFSDQHIRLLSSSLAGYSHNDDLFILGAPQHDHDKKLGLFNHEEILSPQYCFILNTAQFWILMV